MRETTVVVTCDLCRYGGPYTRSEDFQTFGDDVDLCRWCSDDTPKAWAETGGHKVTFSTTTGWSCSCGLDSERWLVRGIKVLVPPRVLAAVPNIDIATANMHLEGHLR